MQTVNKLFTKAKENGGDPHLAMLCLRTTPIDHNLPSHGRRYKSNLPALSSWSDGNVNAFLQQRQDVYKSYHDQTANELAPLYHNRQCECGILFGKHGTWPRSQTKQARRDRTTSCRTRNRVQMQSSALE